MEKKNKTKKRPVILRIWKSGLQKHRSAMASLPPRMRPVGHLLAPVIILLPPVPFFLRRRRPKRNHERILWEPAVQQFLTYLKKKKRR